MAAFQPPKDNILATQHDVIVPRSLINPQKAVPVTGAPPPGDLNPVSRRTTFKYMNVNTANRTRISGLGETAPALVSSSTNCSLNLVSPVRNILSMMVTSINFSSVPYAVAAGKASSTMWIQVDELASIGVDIRILGCFWRLERHATLPSASGYTWYSLQVPDGNYLPCKLRDTINEALSGAGLSKKFCVEFDENSCSFSFHATGNSVKAIAFATDRPVESSLGWIMGFRDRYYVVADAYQQFTHLNCRETLRCSKRCFPSIFEDKTSEDEKPKTPTKDKAAMALTAAVGNQELVDESEIVVGAHCSVYAESTFSLFGSSYLMLCIDDFQTNVDQLFLSDAGANLQTDRIGARQNALARIEFNVGPDGCTLGAAVSPTKRIYFGPVTLEKLKVMLVDHNGEQVDLNNGDFSFCLELESFYKF